MEMLVGTSRRDWLDGAVAILLTAAAACRANVVLSWRGSRCAGDGIVAIIVEFLGARSVLWADTAYPLDLAVEQAAIMPFSWTNVRHAITGLPRSGATPIIGGDGTLLESTASESSLMELSPRH